MALIQVIFHGVLLRTNTEQGSTHESNIKNVQLRIRGSGEVGVGGGGFWFRLSTDYVSGSQAT